MITRVTTFRTEPRFATGYKTTKQSGYMDAIEPGRKERIAKLQAYYAEMMKLDNRRPIVPADMYAEALAECAGKPSRRVLEIVCRVAETTAASVQSGSINHREKVARQIAAVILREVYKASYQRVADLLNSSVSTAQRCCELWKIARAQPPASTTIADTTTAA